MRTKQESLLAEAHRGNRARKDVIKVLELITNHTTCPNSGKGGCLGGPPIPGFGCVHEAAAYALRRLREVEQAEAGEKKR